MNNRTCVRIAAYVLATLVPSVVARSQPAPVKPPAVAPASTNAAWKLGIDGIGPLRFDQSIETAAKQSKLPFFSGEPKDHEAKTGELTDFPLGTKFSAEMVYGDAGPDGWIYEFSNDTSMTSVSLDMNNRVDEIRTNDPNIETIWGWKVGSKYDDVAKVCAAITCSGPRIGTGKYGDKGQDDYGCDCQIKDNANPVIVKLHFATKDRRTKRGEVSKAKQRKVLKGRPITSIDVIKFDRTVDESPPRR
jgi:hypothetical protein